MGMKFEFHSGCINAGLDHDQGHGKEKIMSEASAEKIKILVVDDHPVISFGLKSLLEQYHQFQVVGEATSVVTAVKLAAELKPDVILMDARLGDGTGFEACRKIRETGSQSRVLVFTGYDSEEFVAEAILAGADAYLLKEVAFEKLVQAIQDVAQGKSILDPAVTRKVFERLKSMADGHEKDKLESLSTQEKKVLALVADGKTNKEIAMDMGLSDKTVRNYLSHIMEKLHFSRRSQAAAFYAQQTHK